MDIKEVADLKRQLDEEYKKDNDALERVLALLQKRNGTAPAVKTETNGQQILFRDSGIRGIAKNAVEFVPDTFTRPDLVTAIEQHFPDYRGKTTKDAMSGALQRLVDDGIVRRLKRSSGGKLAVYRKSPQKSNGSG